MEIFEYFLGALQEIATPTGLLFVVLGTLAGVVLGAIPGLGSSTLMVVLLPISYKMDITLAMARRGLFLARRCDVRSKPTSAPIRVLLEFGRTATKTDHAHM